MTLLLLTPYNRRVSSFVHLHLHTQYSLLDGMNTIAPLIETAKQYKMPAVAMTDHGNLFGAIEFYQAAKKAGIKPIIGCEMYMAPKTRFDKEEARVQEDDYKGGDGRANPYYHLILLAANEIGYKNLMKLVSLAHIEGFYYKPRIDKTLLQKYSGGLIGLSGCLRGEVPYLLNLGRESEAQAAAGLYREIFEDRFYIEIQDNGLDLQKAVNKQLILLARRNNLPIVATNDCHYLHKSDTVAHDIMLCLQTGKNVDTPNRMRFDTDQLYFKSSEEMARAFAEIPEAVHNTLEIADRVDMAIPLGMPLRPRYETPPGITQDNHLKSLAETGLSRRLETALLQSPEGSPARPMEAYQERLSSELAIIQSVGYSGYFLVVWDIVHYAKSKGIPVGPGRGSAAGSLVAYAVGITDIDPMVYGLLFERFINPERISPPDIDMDICMDRRGEVLAYISEKFGADHVGQIITFGTMSAKAVIRDVGRVLNIPYGDVDRIAKLIPDRLNITLDEALAQEPRLRQALEEDPKRVEWITQAKALEGLVRHASTHAAGVVIASEPLMEHLPLYKTPHGETVTQYTMEDVEKIGLIKFDFLGLRILTVIDQASRLIRAKQSPFTISHIPLNDAETYTLLGSGETVGLFQLESSGMRDLLVKMKPSQFEDLIALLALYRPGPIESGMVDDFIKRKQGKAIRYELPELEPILKETYGVILYQEQVMRIANVLAGFSLGEADMLRRAMGKKKLEEMAAQKNTFVERATERGVARPKAEKIFDLIEKFAGYGFNKSHSAAYAFITYQTAYLKCHFKQEFMAALLTCEKGNSDKVVRYITECRRMGIFILPPDTNESGKDFTVVDRGIRFGLAGIKNVGSSAVDAILEARQAQGPFKSLLHFCQIVELRKANKRVLESLIKSGAFDFSGFRRTDLLANIESTMQTGEKYKKSAKVPQLSLFDLDANEDMSGQTREQQGTAPPAPRGAFHEHRTGDDEEAVSRMEKETLGFYITAHPLTRYQTKITKLQAVPIEALQETEHPVRICGVVSDKRMVRTKKGDPMAYLQLEDMTGSVEVIVFPDLYRTAEPLIALEQPILLYGTIESGEQGLKVKATGLTLLEKENNGPEGQEAIVTVHELQNSKLKIQNQKLSPEDLSTRPSLECPSMTILLSTSTTDPALIKNLKEILWPVDSSLPLGLSNNQNGPTVYIKITMETGASLLMDTKVACSPSEEVIRRIEELFGKGSVVMGGHNENTA